MAAATVTSKVQDVVGRRRVVYAKIAAPADTNTWDTGLTEGIENVQVTFNDASAIATDSVAVTTSGQTVTFEIAGTGRALFVVAYGKSA